MKKILLIILIIIAIPIYVYDIYHIVGAKMGTGTGSPSKQQEHSSGSDPFGLVMQSSRTVAFAEKGKSPFDIYKTVPRPKPKPKPRRRRPKSKPAPKPLPRVTINGIMWSESNPVAVLILPNGSSVVANAGKELAGGITVKKVEKTRVQLTHDGRDFWVEK